MFSGTCPENLSPNFIIAKNTVISIGKIRNKKKMMKIIILIFIVMIIIMMIMIIIIIMIAMTVKKSK